MAKYCGKLGFIITQEDEDQSGKYTPTSVERKYYGDILEDVRKWEKQETATTNDDLNIMNRISVLADKFATENLGALKYAEFMGTMWNVKSVTISYPRLILSLGGLYNGTRQSDENSEEFSEEA